MHSLFWMKDKLDRREWEFQLHEMLQKHLRPCIPDNVIKLFGTATRVIVANYYLMSTHVQIVKLHIAHKREKHLVTNRN